MQFVYEHWIISTCWLVLTLASFEASMSNFNRNRKDNEGDE